MTRKVSIPILFLLLSISVHAATIYEVPKDKGVFSYTWEKIIFCKWHISCYWQQHFGAAITTINATDRITDSRSTINTNFTNLNTDKIEVGTTSVGNITTLSNLVTVGTLTSGSLGSGFTTVVVGRGGTGSTTLSQYQLLIGSSTNAVSVVSGLGSSGQFLTSQGTGQPPQWTTAAVDQALAYNWSGNHNFTASTSQKFFTASSTITIKDTNSAGNTTTNTMVLPTSTGSASTTLFNALGGNPVVLTWTNPNDLQLLAASTTPAATTSINVVGFPARKSLYVEVYIDNIGGTGTSVTFRFNGDDGSNYGHTRGPDDNASAMTSANADSKILTSIGADGRPGLMWAQISNISGTRKLMSYHGMTTASVSTSAPTGQKGYAVWNDTTNQITRIQIYPATVTDTFAAGSWMRIYGSRE